MNIYTCNCHSFELNNVRLETSAVYRVVLTQLHTQVHIVEPSFLAYVHQHESSPLPRPPPPPSHTHTYTHTHGVLSSLEQTAWPRGEPGSSSDCMDGSVRLCCASMFLRAEHRALFTAVCPFLTLAPFFYVNRLFMARDRQTWLTSESIFQVIIWLA